MWVTRLKAGVFQQHRPKVWIVVADEADEKCNGQNEWAQQPEN
jgi:hypothetical protein